MINIKKFICVLIILPIAVLILSINANAVDENPDSKENTISETFDNQLKISGADSLFNSLPQETRKILADMGITSLNYDTITNINTSGIFEQITALIGTNSSTPFGSMMVCLGIMLLCSLVESFNVTIGEKAIGTVSSAVGALCVCTAIIVPVCSTISRTVEILNGASGFLLMYIPIMAGLLVASGKEVSGASYYSMMMCAGEVISQLSSKIIAPLMNIFLALSVTSSLSPRMRLNSLCSSVYKVAKWILTFSMSVFVTILSVQTFVTSSMDNVSRRALRFAVSSFVPVVGGALSEALTAFTGSVELLKSGAGVFVIIASSFVFLPVLIECIVWQFSFFFMTSASDIFGLNQMTNIFKMISKVISMIVAVLLCTMTIFIISTVIILLVGR